jgi:anaerobic magnesium-protoporphyrin IX monomethyl ester cyclase
MRVLLFSMPDSFEHMPAVVIRMPNGGLTSLAGNIDPHHQVSVADLILVQHRLHETVEELVRTLQPDIVGFSIMSFQRETGKSLIRLVRQLKPDAKVVVGGYGPSLATDAYTNDFSCPVDFIVRGEGERTFRELLRAVENRGGYNLNPGLSYRTTDGFFHNPSRPVSPLQDDTPLLPKREARALKGYTFLGRQVDVVKSLRRGGKTCHFLVHLA